MKPTVSDIAQAAIEAALESLKSNGMEDQVRHLWSALREEIDAREGVLVATITTPNGASGALKDRLSKELSAKFGRSIDIVEKKDPSILGGVIIEFGDERIDMSLRGSLAKAKTTLQSSSND